MLVASHCAEVPDAESLRQQRILRALSTVNFLGELSVSKRVTPCRVCEFQHIQPHLHTRTTYFCLNAQTQTQTMMTCAKMYISIYIYIYVYMYTCIYVLDMYDIYIYMTQTHHHAPRHRPRPRPRPRPRHRDRDINVQERRNVKRQRFGQK